MIWSCYYKFNYYTSIIKNIRLDLIEFNKSKGDDFVKFMNSKPKGHLTKFPSLDESFYKLMIMSLVGFLEKYKSVHVIEKKRTLKENEVYHLNESCYVVNGKINIVQSDTSRITFNIDPNSIKVVDSKTVVNYSLPSTHDLRLFLEKNFKLYEIAYNIERLGIFRKIKHIRNILKTTDELSRSDIAEAMVDLNNIIRNNFGHCPQLYDFFDSLILFDKDNEGFKLLYRNNTVTLIRNYI